MTSKKPLADLIVEHGPYRDGAIPPEVVHGFDDAERLNELRDELVALRAACAPDPEPCTAETRSWDHFRPEQIDSYWIRCSLAGEHDEHEDSHTGLTWRSTEAAL